MSVAPHPCRRHHWEYQRLAGDNFRHCGRCNRWQVWKPGTSNRMIGYWATAQEAPMQRRSSGVTAPLTGETP
jgi:hypothetical protein